MEDLPVEDVTATVTDTATWFMTATTSAMVSISTGILEEIGDDTGDMSGIGVGGSETVTGGASDGNPFVNFMLGLVIVLLASFANALGLNLTKLDHNKTLQIPKRERKPDWMRPVWVGGMAIYIASQLFGSTLSLRYIRAEWVAPLGSSSLIFNVWIAKMLLGTPITQNDVRGTALIVGSVILILIFSSINHGLDSSLSLDRLSSMWARGPWLAWFFLLVAFSFSAWFNAHLLHALLSSRASLSPTQSLPSLPPKPSLTLTIKRNVQKAESWALKRLDRMMERTGDEKVKWLEGVAWAVLGGSLAGISLVFTKACVKLAFGEGHPFRHPVPLLTLFFLGVTAVSQIITLNRALKCADPTLVVPLFYAGYTVLGFINSLIFLDETGKYSRWVLIAVFMSIGLLVGGVILLSLKQDSTKREPTVSVNASESMRMNPRAAEGESETMWEVGSASDDEDAVEEGKGKSVAVRGDTGERGGLLDREEDEEAEVEGKKDEEEFGEFERARR